MISTIQISRHAKMPQMAAVMAERPWISSATITTMGVIMYQPRFTSSDTTGR